eukprot:gnl/TRDRNA2_/TRDRNA2_91771_c0_seq1.p1 gnl/TRDRNA2_/TRDRNA2_91771_c0~~gnl/TRDRNA2_/TRDRNA2_91771_c0_seq1.p1  ORF type:complete len:389 (+),score=50.54 gnl/TRDRNA2_/TRDRNA2_91771_c0_seq1:77-1243(+)
MSNSSLHLTEGLLREALHRRAICCSAFLIYIFLLLKFLLIAVLGGGGSGGGRGRWLTFAAHAEVPTAHSAGRRLSGAGDTVESSQTARKILAAATLFGRLGLPDQEADQGLIRKSYRQLALTVHPDKCKEPDAKAAFQRLSEAFEELSSVASQRAYLVSLSKVSAAPGSQRPITTTAAPRPTSRPGRKAKWWDTKTWEEFEERLKTREAAEKTMQQNFRSRMSAMHALTAIRQTIIRAERLVKTLDDKHKPRLPPSDLWPPEYDPVTGMQMTLPGAAKRRPELDDQEYATTRVVDILTYLRSVHLYCIFCECDFKDTADMSANCPGFTEEEHDNVPMHGAGQKTDGKPDEPDPLDEYMAQVDQQFQNDLKGGPAKKRRTEQDRFNARR